MGWRVGSTEDGSSMKTSGLTAVVGLFERVRDEAHSRVDLLGNNHPQFGALMAGIAREEVRLSREISDSMEAIHRFGALARDFAPTPPAKKAVTPGRAAGGYAAASKRTPAERSALARKAAAARWAK